MKGLFQKGLCLECVRYSASRELSTNVNFQEVLSPPSLWCLSQYIQSAPLLNLHFRLVFFFLVPRRSWSLIWGYFTLRVSEGEGNSPPSIDENSNMTPRLSGHFPIFGLVFFVLKSLLGIARQWSRKKNWKPQSHVRSLIYRSGAISHRACSHNPSLPALFPVARDHCGKRRQSSFPSSLSRASRLSWVLASSTIPT